MVRDGCRVFPRPSVGWLWVDWRRASGDFLYRSSARRSSFFSFHSVIYYSFEYHTGYHHLGKSFPRDNRKTFFSAHSLHCKPSFLFSPPPKRTGENSSLKRNLSKGMINPHGMAWDGSITVVIIGEEERVIEEIGETDEEIMKISTHKKNTSRRNTRIGS